MRESAVQSKNRRGTTYAKNSSGRPTFVNVGRKYPNKARFTIVIWGKHRGNFPFKPEVKYRGKTLIATGKITLYKGSAPSLREEPGGGQRSRSEDRVSVAQRRPRPQRSPLAEAPWTS